ncbi:MAG TPA: epoxide hydrolase N-terminal domain-containing protein [Candidatus Binatia bacterium]|nr:epoxide hydrolase N-terminal domain-containing protein [Candidatus Binatia bacterium]
MVAVCGVLLFAVTGYAQDTPIRAFKVNVSEESLADLRRRIAAAQWPEKETVTDQSQGVQLATMQELARYWATDYDKDGHFAAWEEPQLFAAELRAAFKSYGIERSCGGWRAPDVRVIRLFRIGFVHEP